MGKRYVSIYFRHLLTDWLMRKHPELREGAFVLAAAEHGRMIVRGASASAAAKGISVGMVVADCRALLPDLKVLDDQPATIPKLLGDIGEWLIRYTPIAAIDPSDGLILDVSGCTHLWGGEAAYLKEISSRLQAFGYSVRMAMADTVGCAWAFARYGRGNPIIESGGQWNALLTLPPAALRIDEVIQQRMIKLGLYQVHAFIRMPHQVLRRRFGIQLIQRLKQALGEEIEAILPLQPSLPFQERLPSLEPIRTAVGIQIALRKLLEELCKRMVKEGLGIRNAVFKGYRVDGLLQQIQIGTNSASRDVEHLYRLFELNIATIRPGLGIELFILEAPLVEELSIEQEQLWNIGTAKDEQKVTELLDRISGKLGGNVIHRYLPDEHHWPERSFRLAKSLHEKPDTEWNIDLPRPLNLLPKPELIQVSVPLPDYPPMLFRYKGELHKVARADGPERIEQEWWMAEGEHRDYYCLEDELGARFWVFRSGHYHDGSPEWFLHGFFA